MTLLVGLYLDPDPERRGEFSECLRRNTRNEWIEEIQVFVETPADRGELLRLYPPLESPKVTLIANGRRVSYQDLFAHANLHLAGRRVMIANADIYFDHTLARLDGFDLSGKLLCLSRWDMAADGCLRFFDHAASQDAWIFQSPIREFPCGFHLGVPGCDNCLAWQARQSGLKLSNPGRSIRALHLHLSGVRRYSERDRLAGAGHSISPGFLGTAWLWFVIPCIGRLSDVRNTIDSFMQQERSTYVLVDFAGPEPADAVWVREHAPCAIVAHCDAQQRPDGAGARNRGAAEVDDDGILCFLDADVTVAPDFSLRVLSSFEPGTYLIADQTGPGLSTALICTKADFDRVGGFDENFRDWGEEVPDVRDSLSRAGLRERTFPASLLSHSPKHGETDDSERRDREVTLAIHAAYRRVKKTVIGEHGISRGTLRAIYEAIARRHDLQRLDAEQPFAAVSFRESMGYSIALLEAGASSHNNDLRPFANIPEPLTGRLFTQVVACSVSPIEVEFLASGKLYVLVGTDWDGCRIACACLREIGQPEPIPPVQTLRGTGFEVWSLLGQAGDRVVLPTQVMLVADRLERK